MFVRELVVRQDQRTYRYLKVVESARERGRKVQRTLVNLGNVNQWPEDKLQEMIRLLSRFLCVDLPELNEVRFSECRQLGPFLALSALWHELDLDSIIAQALAHRKVDLPVAAFAQAMVFNRLVEPRSKKAVWETMAREVQLPGIEAADLPLHGYYRTLEYLAASKSFVEQELHARLRHLFNRDLSLVFYDLTSSYFEGDGPSQAKHGYSRDHRPDRVQIQIGLLVDAEGIPIGHEVFDGNLKDVATVVGTVKRLQSEFAVQRCVFVSDNGMASEENLATLERTGYEYITSVGLRKHGAGPRLLQSLPPRSTFRKLKDNLFLQSLVEQDAPGPRYIASYNPERAAIGRRKRRRRLRTCIDYLRQLQAPPKPRARPRTPAEIQRKAESFLRRKTCDALIRLGQDPNGGLTWGLKGEALRLERRCDGLLILLTNSRTLTDEEVVRGYRELWRVEDAFRHIKDLVQLRPIRHWKDARVLGHVFVCVLAYMLERVLEKRLRAAKQSLSARRALEVLRPITVATLHLGDKRIRRRSEIGAEQRAVLKAAGVETVPEIW